MKNTQKETVIKMFCNEPTSTLPKGWYQVTLRKTKKNPNYSSRRWWDNTNNAKTVSIPANSLKDATKGQVVNAVGNKVTTNINKFSLSPK